MANEFSTGFGNANTILFLVSSMHAGGAERVASLLCNHWGDSGHAVYLVPTFSGRGECLYELNSNVQLIYLADRPPLGTSLIPGKLRRLFALRKLIKEIQPDVVISFLSNVNIAALLATAGMTLPVVVSERTYPPAMPLDALQTRLRKHLYPRAAAVVMQTNRGLQWLKSACPGANGAVIGNPVMLPLPPAHPVILPDTVLLPSKRMLLAVGRLGPEKGFAELVAAFAPLVANYPDWNLVILGEGAERQRLENLCAESGIAGNVFLPGRVGNMQDWYERADIFALSSHYEGFPNALLEAMAHGVPGVSFDCHTGPRTIIRDGEDGILVDPAGGPAELGKALANVMSDPRKLARMAVAAKEVRQRFGLAEIAKQWEALLRSCAP